MASAYGCNVFNKFGLELLDDLDCGDPADLIEKASAMVMVSTVKVKALKKEEEKTKTIDKNIHPSTTTATSTSERGGRGRGRGRGGPSNRSPRAGTDLADRFGEDGGRRGSRGSPRGGRGSRPNRGRGGNANTVTDLVNEGAVDPVASQPIQERQRNGRGGRGRGRGKFERRTGSAVTGVRSIEKKEGWGKGNWGNALSESIAAADTVEEPIDVENVEETPETPVVKEKTPEELEYEAFMEAQSKLKTLQEYKNEQKEKVESSGFKIRKAGEGEDNTNLPKLVPIKKVEIEEPKEEITVVRKESTKKILPANFQILHPNRGRSERGGRGSRGNRGRGQYRA